MQEGPVPAQVENPLPGWVPANARAYLRHVESGHSIRDIARGLGCHASTVLRRIRRFEELRDDPLVDRGLRRLGRMQESGALTGPDEELPEMNAMARQPAAAIDETRIAEEGRRILRRLCETGTVLAVAPELDRAAVLRTGADGHPARIAVVERAVAEAFALKDWIAATGSGRVASYRITTAGRAALKRLLSEEQSARHGFAEAQTPFGDQHRDWGSREVTGAAGERARRVRCNMAESPMAILARRKDRDGRPFLPDDLVAAGERLREDFELAQMGPRVAQNWDRFLTSGSRGGLAGGSGPAEGPRAARDRVAAALADLGPGLGDVALRCVCYMEGMETTEQRMGWSARSGKIVLRIALMRLRRHYEAECGTLSPMIG